MSLQALTQTALARIGSLEDRLRKSIEDISPGLSDFLYDSVDIKSKAGLHLVLIKLDELEAEL